MKIIISFIIGFLLGGGLIVNKIDRVIYWKKYLKDKYDWFDV